MELSDGDLIGSLGLLFILWIMFYFKRVLCSEENRLHTIELMVLASYLSLFSALTIRCLLHLQDLPASNKTCKAHFHPWSV